MNIGWIGLGQIGLPMVLALLRAGHTVVAHSRRPGEHQAVIELGGTLVDTAKETLIGIDALGINVFSEPQLDDIMKGQQGILRDVPEGTRVFIHSTIGPAFMRQLAGQRPDLHWLDCAFSGTAEDVANKNLTLMVGGDKSHLNELTPVLSAYCKHIHHVGDIGAGMALKIINNALFAANVQLALDALHAVTDTGLDVQLAGQVLSQSSGGSYALKTLMAGDNPFDVALAIKKYMDKDVEVARQSAKASNINLGRITQITA